MRVAGGPRYRRVLSIDGGGVRGIIPAIVLAEFERRTSRPAAQLFDLIAGTSTGGILALGLVSPGPDGSPRWTAEELVDFYDSHCPSVFAHDRRQSLHSLGGYVHERYEIAPLERVLGRYFGDTRISESLTDVVVPAYDVTSHTPHFFRSVDAKADPSQDCLIRDVARATSAAPTYFAPDELGMSSGAMEAVMLDGGLFANNPAMCAFIEAQRGHEGHGVRLLSLGTGEMTREYPADQIRHWGMAQWARPIIHVVLEGASHTVDAQLSELLDGEHYLRLQVSLTKARDELDDASRENIEALKDHAQQLIAANGRQLDDFCQELTDADAGCLF